MVRIVRNVTKLQRQVQNLLFCKFFIHGQGWIFHFLLWNIRYRRPWSQHVICSKWLVRLADYGICEIVAEAQVLRLLVVFGYSLYTIILFPLRLSKKGRLFYYTDKRILVFFIKRYILQLLFCKHKFLKWWWISSLLNRCRISSIKITLPPLSCLIMFTQEFKLIIVFLFHIDCALLV